MYGEVSLLQLRNCSAVAALVWRGEFETLDEIVIAQEMVHEPLKRAGAEAVDDPHTRQARHVCFVDKAVKLVVGLGGGLADEVKLGGDVAAVDGTACARGCIAHPPYLLGFRLWCRFGELEIG